jgi:tetratricopeptide (TPR) repeat protein
MTRFLTGACALILVFAAGCGYFTSPEERIERAEALIAQGEYRSALIELRNAQEGQPDLPKARLLFAEVALWMGDPAAAERELKAAPADHDPARRADLALRIDLALGRHAEVLARIGTPDDKQPAVLWLYRGTANQALGNHAEAERDYRAAVQRDAGLIAAHAGIIEMRVVQNDTNDAFERSRMLTRDHPDSALAWFVRGGLLASAASMREAQDALVHAAELAPKQLDMLKHAALLVMLTEVQITNRDLEAARATSASLSRLAPGSAVAALEGARIQMAANDFAAAAVELRRLVNRTPQFTHARFLLGVSLAAQGNFSQANQELTQVVEETPHNAEARQLLAKVRLRLDDPDSALRLLVPALDTAEMDRATNLLFESASAQLGDETRSLTLIEREYNKSPGNRGLKMQLAAAYIRAQQGAKAQALLRDTDLTGDPAATRLMLAATAQAEGDDAARRKLEAMLAARPNDLALVLLAAQMHVAAREDQRARQLIEGALRRHPDDVGLKLALARVQLVTGDRDAAVATLTQVRRQDARNSEARLMLAQLALARDDAKEAATLVTEAVSGAERVSETHNAAGLMYLTTARYDSAIEHFLAGAAADPSDANLALNLARAQLALQQNEAARVSLQRALSLRANWLPAEGAMAFLELETGNSAAALKRVDALRTARPHDPQVMVLEAEVRTALRQYIEADRILALAARRQPSPAIAVKNYQIRLAGKLPKPTEPLEAWVLENPDDVQMRRTLADAYAQSGLRDKAAQQYEAVTARRPKDPIALNNLAWLYFEMGDRRALETARRAAELAPDSAEVADTLGWILVQAGSLKEGLPVLQRASEKNPRNGDMQYHYAAALAKSGNPTDAAVRLQAVLAATPEFPSRKDAEALLGSLSKPKP